MILADVAAGVVRIASAGMVLLGSGASVLAGDVPLTSNVSEELNHWQNAPAGLAMPPYSPTSGFGVARDFRIPDGGALFPSELSRSGRTGTFLELGTEAGVSTKLQPQEQTGDIDGDNPPPLTGVFLPSRTQGK